jgi:hypothetical protein
MFDARPIGTVDEEDFANVPCEIESLLGSVVHGVVAEGVDDIEGAREVEGVTENELQKA